MLQDHLSSKYARQEENGKQQNVLILLLVSRTHFMQQNDGK